METILLVEKTSSAVTFLIPHASSSAGVRKSAQTLMGFRKGFRSFTVCRATAPKPTKPTG